MDSLSSFPLSLPLTSSYQILSKVFLNETCNEMYWTRFRTQLNPKFPMDFHSTLMFLLQYNMCTVPKINIHFCTKIIHYLGTYGLVAVWCHQYGLLLEAAGKIRKIFITWTPKPISNDLPVTNYNLAIFRGSCDSSHRMNGARTHDHLRVWITGECSFMGFLARFLNNCC